MSSIVSVEELIESGVHFGHQVSRWNPKMAPFIHAKQNYIHLIDLKETIRGLIRARHFLSRVASLGEQILLVGTKRQVRNVVEAEATRAGLPRVTERWIGGTLTNFQTIRSRLKRLEELERMEKEGELAALSKKQQARFRRELRKIRRNLEGIRNMDGLPGAVVVVDPKREFNAVHEANILSIPVVAILDTDCDPDVVDIPIPANDDAMRSVQLILSKLVDGIIEGQNQVTDEIREKRKRRLEELEMAERDLLAPPSRGRGPGRGRGGPRGGEVRGGMGRVRGRAAAERAAGGAGKAGTAAPPKTEEAPAGESAQAPAGAAAAQPAEGPAPSAKPSQEEAPRAPEKAPEKEIQGSGE